MNTNATETRLREIASRENKATKGPWKKHNLDVNTVTMKRRNRCVVFHGRCDSSECDPKAGFAMEGDALFIAHSRQDVPWLLALIKKQREALVADALADKLFERAEAHREESIACGYDNDPTGSLAVAESYKAANEQALIAAQLKKDALNFSPENL